MREIERKIEEEGQQVYTMEELDNEFSALNGSAAPGPDNVVKSLFPKKLENKQKLLNYINDVVFRRRIPTNLLESRLNFIDKTPISAKKGHFVVVKDC